MFQNLLDRLRTIGGGRGQRSMTDGGTVVSPPGGTAQESSEANTAARTDGMTDAETSRSPSLGMDTQTFADAIGVPAFMLGPDGRIRLWNRSIAELTGRSAEEAVGHDHASEMFYPDGRRAKTLADKVLEAPDHADEAFGLSLADENVLLYEDSSTMVDRHGEKKHIDFTAQPIFEDGSLIGVVEVVRDRTDHVRRNEAIRTLVEEIQTTLAAVTSGQLDSRASRPKHQALLDDELLTVIDQLNHTVSQLQELTGGVERRAEALDEHIETATEAASRIAENVDEQNELLAEGVGEMQTFSASMEEVAATAEQVDGAAEQARNAAEQGLEASEDAEEATDEVVDIGDELVERVTTLGEQMDDIEDVVEVISDVAEQTNLLALNANIEAARAGEDGDGFAVVAEEVKTLADETRTHTEEITASIENLQEHSDETVAAATQSHERISHAGDQIEGVLDAFGDIAESIDEAADGIAEVSRATDDQAATVEELTTTLETVRDRAEGTEAATAEIVTATEHQRDAIEELTTRVTKLRGETDDRQAG